MYFAEWVQVNTKVGCNMEEKMKERERKNGQDSFTIFQLLAQPIPGRK